MRGNTSVRPSEFLGLDWQLGRGALSISSSSSCSHLAFVTGGLPARRLQSPNAAKCVVFGSIVEREGGCKWVWVEFELHFYVPSMRLVVKSGN